MKVPRFKARTKYLLLLLVLVTGVVMFSMSNFSNAIREGREKAVEAAAKLAVTEIDGNKIDFWYENGKDEDYFKTESELHDILFLTPNLRFLYVYKILPDGFRVIFDFPSPYDENAEVQPDNLGDKVSFDSSFKLPVPEGIVETKDSYGWLLSKYEPIFDSAGNIVAYVGVDISVLESYEQRDYIMMKIIGFVMLFSILSLLIVDIIVGNQNHDRKLLDEFVSTFASVIDLKDSYTQGHSFRVAKYTYMLAKELGYDDETVKKYHKIALLHDIGKIGIPDQVLNKPGKLTKEEFNLIKSHTTRGYEVLKNISLMPEIAVGAKYHHERPDGKGYPNGLKGDEIPRVAQIIAVADTFDAMYSTRKYRKRMKFEKVVSTIRDARGTQLTADVVDAFMRIVEKGGLRASDDHGGGSEDSIDNISSQKA